MSTLEQAGFKIYFRMPATLELRQKERSDTTVGGKGESAVRFESTATIIFKFTFR